MAKLTRQQQQIFAGQAPSDMIAAFGSTQTGTPVYSTDLSTLQTTNYQQGWQDAIIADKAPFLEEMNGVQYGLSYQIAYAQQMGIPEWLSTQDYYINSRAIGSDGNIYKSLTDSNTGNNPVLDDGTNWVLDTIPEANVLNYITNCITSAPNGVPSYSGTTVTVQEGTNYLFPNGRNSNNQIQNVNFSLASAVTGTISGSTSATYCVFVTSELDLIFVNNVNYFITNTQPTALNTTTTAGVWFNPQTNLIYQCAATASIPSWSNFKGAICATLTYDGSTITAFNPIYPIELSNKLNITLDNATQTTINALADKLIPKYSEAIQLDNSYGVEKTYEVVAHGRVNIKCMSFYTTPAYINLNGQKIAAGLSTSDTYTDPCTVDIIVRPGDVVTYISTGNAVHVNDAEHYAYFYPY